jgi:hypothetical protein
MFSAYVNFIALMPNIGTKVLGITLSMLPITQMQLPPIDGASISITRESRFRLEGTYSDADSSWNYAITLGCSTFTVTWPM